MQTLRIFFERISQKTYKEQGINRKIRIDGRIGRLIGTQKYGCGIFAMAFLDLT